MSSMDIRERMLEFAGTEAFEEILRTAFSAMMREMHTAIPTKLEKDSDGKTVNGKALIKAQVRNEKGEIEHVELPTFAEAPINFTAGGGVTHTYPLKENDEGLTIFASRAVAAWREEGGVQKAVDARSHNLSDGFFVPGVRSKPRDLKDINTEAAENRSDDGKQRGIVHPQNGIKTTVNGGKQIIDVNAKTGQVEVKSKTVTVSAGDAEAGRGANTENTQDRELNEQIKGLAARLGQQEKAHAGLFDVVSRFRQNADSIIPALALANQASQVTAALNGAPGGMDAMVSQVEGKAMAYLQTQMQQALGMFLNPTLGDVASLIPGGLEGIIAGIRAQIAELVKANPALGQIADLERNIEAVRARNAAPDVEASQLQEFAEEVERLTKENPAAAIVQQLTDRLKGLMGQAGPAMNFLEPQKRAAQGVIKSIRFTE